MTSFDVTEVPPVWVPMMEMTEPASLQASGKPMPLPNSNICRRGVMTAPDELLPVFPEFPDVAADAPAEETATTEDITPSAVTTIAVITPGRLRPRRCLRFDDVIRPGSSHTWS